MSARVPARRQCIDHDLAQAGAHWGGARCARYSYLAGPRLQVGRKRCRSSSRILLCREHRGRLLHGIDNRVIAGAAAIMAGNCLPDSVGAKGPGLCTSSSVAGDENAGRAKAALQSVARKEGVLQRPRDFMAGCREAFDRQHVPTGGLHREDQASADRGARPS